MLLAALCRLGARGLRAVHVDHGLNPESATWAEHCARVAARLGASFAAVRVTVERGAASGLEAAAREARYRALADLMLPGEIVLTAHHADDQLETVLLRLLRGAGVRGMRGIRELAPFGRGWLGRPLLGSTRSELRAHAEAWGLDWLTDPSNADPRHDRSFLRLDVVPALVGRWPAAARRAARLAEQMADAEAILAEVAAGDARSIDDPRRVPRSALVGLAAPRQRNLLRHLVRGAGLGVPSAQKIEELGAALAGPRQGKGALVQWAGADARVFRDHLYLLPAMPPPSAPGYRATLGKEAVWSGPEGQISFEAVTAGPGLPESWLDAGLELRFRSGGERFRPLDRERSRPLKDWLNAAAIVPWMRNRMPLLYRGDVLVAVADLWLGADVGAAAPTERCWRVTWTEHPPLR